MQSYHDLIKKEICYNEIIDDRHFNFDIADKTKFENAIIQLKDGSILLVLEIENSSANLLYEIKKARRDILCEFLSKLESQYEIFYEWNKTEDENEKYIDMTGKLDKGAKLIEEIRRVIKLIMQILIIILNK